MTQARYRYVFLGLSVTSSWGNGHATTYRALLRELTRREHDVVFLERDMPFYASHRDLPVPPYGRTILYGSLDELFDTHRRLVSEADLTVVGSYVPQGCAVGDWACSIAPRMVAFYDIDTPITLRKIDAGDDEYVSRALIPRYALYLSFTGGPTLRRIEDHYGAAWARPLYCSVDPELYAPDESALCWEFGYLGTYSDDRQPSVERLLFEPARACKGRQFIVAGAQYPASVGFPANVEHVEHLPPREHASFYAAQRFTLNVTRQAMIAAGWSPSVRLFEAGACGTPIISDRWPGIEHFLTPEREILLADDANDVLRRLNDLPEPERIAVGRRARTRILGEHTAAHRAETLERYTRELLERETTSRRKFNTPTCEATK